MKKSRSKADKEHLGRLADLGCCVCHREGHGFSPCEIHHTRASAGAGQRSPDMLAIGLCPPHHRTGGYGVAIHAGQKAFEDKYGKESELIEWTAGQIN